MGFLDKIRRKAQPEVPKIRVEKGRAQWANQREFLLTCIGYSVGLGNVWRFPYLCYKNGGGAFLIPYLIMMILIGMPLLFMEYSFGQYFGVGSITIFNRVCPMFRGVGVGYAILNGLVCIYYQVIIALSLYYLFASFQWELPWMQCDQEWNTPQCGDPRPGNITNITTTNLINGTFFNSSGQYGYQMINSTATTIVSVSVNSTYNSSLPRMSPTEEYWKYKLLEITDGIEHLGGVRWHLCLCLLLAWIFVIIFVSRGIQSSGKVVYFTATFPYVMLTVLVVRGVTLPGAIDGIKYFILPSWKHLAEPKVWFSAAAQLFYSTNLAWGGMITMASYSTFHHNCYRDAIVINIVSFFTSLYAGFAVFSVIGYMANEYGIKVEEVIDSGPGLAFIAYPRALGLMPLAPMWTALFFFMLFLLGIGSQMVDFETVITTIADECPSLRKGRKRLGLVCVMSVIFFLLGIPCVTQMVGFETVMTGLTDEFPILARRRLLTVVALAILLFLLGLPCVTQGGMYVLQLMDWYSAGACVLVIAVTECVAINWVYGNMKFAENIKEMLGSLPNIWWRTCWKYISPILIAGVLVFSLIDYNPVTYGKYSYPVWADVLGWMMTLASVIPIIVIAIYMVAKAEGETFKEKLINATTPDKSATEHTRRDSHGNLKPVPTEEKELTANVEEEPDLDESLI